MRNRKFAAAGATVALVAGAWGITHAPAEILPATEVQEVPQSEMTVGPVYTQREALDACTLYTDVQMEMDCRQAAFDTKWPENAGGLEHPQ